MSNSTTKEWLGKTSSLNSSLRTRELDAQNRKRRKLKLSPIARRDLRLSFDLEGLRSWLVDRRITGMELLWRCEFCNDLINVQAVSLDHDRPLSMGGATALENLLIVCKRCNTSKWQLGSEQFRELRRCVFDWPREMQAAFWRRWNQLPAYLGRARKRAA